MTVPSSTGSRTHRAVRVLPVVALLSCGALCVGSCSGLTPGSSSTGQASTGPVSTTLPSTPVTLEVISSENTGTTKALGEAFHAKYPNITVDFRYTAFDDYNKSLNLALSADDGPDLALLNKLGTTVDDNLLRSLDPYAKAYGWDKTYPAAELDQWRATDDGRQLGTGHLWAAPAGFSLVGLYYNKDQASRLGITPPTNRAQFDAALDKAKAAGVLPIQMGNLQGGSSFGFQSIVDSVDGAAESRDWVNGKNGSTVNTPGGREAADTLLNWATKGYIPDGANGTGLVASVANFTKGQGLFFFDGSWDAPVIEKGMPGNAGFVAFPGSDGSTTGIGTSSAYGIPAKAKNPDVAAAFLDFMNTEEAAQIELDTGFLPVAHAETVNRSSVGVMNEIVTAWGEVSKNNGLVNFFANTSATMIDTLTSQSQKLIGGKINSQQYLDALQSDWDKAHQ
ncbi:ABC transporter substrate-binding protein [Kitasatospora indigofera]|uniref:ABC transporter substrate-binding protein n=1 Tax=Kitasatospora indigofera TaxID=67307 RepID=UPI0036B93E96